jgi:hypothetical protein
MLQDATLPMHGTGVGEPAEHHVRDSSWTGTGAALHALAGGDRYRSPSQSPEQVCGSPAEESSVTSTP